MILRYIKQFSIFVGKEINKLEINKLEINKLEIKIKYLYSI